MKTENINSKIYTMYTLDQKYIDILTSQKKELLEEKKKLGLLKRTVFRSYTDWVVTDIVKEYEGQKAYGTDINYVKIGEPYYYSKQTQVRMRLSDGSIEKSEIKI